MDKNKNWYLEFYKVTLYALIIITLLIVIGWVCSPTDWTFKFMVDDNLKDVVLRVYDNSTLINNTYSIKYLINK